MLFVPCQVILQPPDCLPILSAASPATNICCVPFRGRTWSLFLSNTKDSRTAWRATSRCASAPMSDLSPDNGRFAGLGFSNNPARTFTRKIRRTASLIRDMAMVPSLTCASVLSNKAFQSLGTMKISRPALIACAQSSLLQPFTCP